MPVRTETEDLGVVNTFQQQFVIIAKEPSTEMITRAIVAVLLAGPASENEQVIKQAALYLEYSMLVKWEPHPLTTEFRVNLSSADTRAK